MSRDDYIKKTDEKLEQSYDEPMTLDEYVDLIFERPELASQAAKYILQAIESLGTRTVIEEGEEKERYRFFDDPYNDGEHAVLGNTDILNRFVDDLRSIAAGRGKEEKIIWFDGPTATGKSEFKRCLINGLREYSKTPDGRRYTLEWNTKTTTSPNPERGMTYGDSSNSNEDDWYESPVQVHPLSVFPPDIRRDIVADLNDESIDSIPFNIDVNLDPFSQEAYDTLEEYYRREGADSLFSNSTGDRHLRVKNYVMDVGQGIGVLYSEDVGQMGERLVGSWMPGMIQKLDSRGQKNPQAFSYDGVLSQGNNGLTIVEDAAQHADLLQKMLNVPDEQKVKLDKGISMDIDTLLLIISNPNLDAELKKHEDYGQSDPLKALKRRLEKHEFDYLTNLSLETLLLHRELDDEPYLWEADDYADLKQKIESPMNITIQNGDDYVERELSPHALEAAAMFNIVSRLDPSDLPAGLDLVDKALLFDKGYIKAGDELLEKDDFDFKSNSTDGDNGIPVTFTRDVIATLLQEDLDRQHPEIDVGSTVMPSDVLTEMRDQMANEPVIAEKEALEYEERLSLIEYYIFDEQEQDVLDALMRQKSVDEETVQEYVQHVYAWATDERIENQRGEEIDPEPLSMKIFEIEHLNRFNENDYEGNEPRENVRDFREDTVINAINKFIWDHRDDDFAVKDINPKEISIFKNILGTHNWEAVKRQYKDLNPSQWNDPPSDTETEQIKNETIKNMMEMFGYSRASAELTTQLVMNEISHKFDN